MIDLTINGIDYSFPEEGEEEWGGDVTTWAAAVTGGMLQKAGGTFTLTADVDFGASYGLKSSKFSTRTANPASAGLFRLASADAIKWRNAANDADLTLNVVGDALYWEGVDISSPSLSNPMTTEGDIITGAALGNPQRLAAGTEGYYLKVISGIPTWAEVVASGGDVVGPAGATDEAFARYDTATGKLLQDSLLKQNDTGEITLEHPDAVDNDLVYMSFGSALDPIVAASASVMELEIYSTSSWSAVVEGTAFSKGLPASAELYGMSFKATPDAGDDISSYIFGISSWMLSTPVGNAYAFYSIGDWGFDLFKEQGHLNIGCSENMGAPSNIYIDGSESAVGDVCIATLRGYLISGTHKVDTISEKTADTGVTIDSVLIKDGAIAKSVVGLTNVTDDAQIAKSIGTTKGDLIGFSASATPGRLGIGTDGYVLTADAAETLGVKWAAVAAGDVVGPASSTDNAIARYDSTTGKLIQNSTLVVTDIGNLSGLVSAQQSIQDQIAQDGTTLYFPLDDATPNTSVTNIGSTITLNKTGTGTLAANSTYYFNATGKGVTFNENAQLYGDTGVPVGTQDFLVEWDGRIINHSGSYCCAFQHGAAANANPAIFLYIGTTTSAFAPSIVLYMSDGAGNYKTCSWTSSQYLATNGSHRYKLVVDRDNNTNTKLYIDDVEQSKGSCNIADHSAVDYTGTYLSIGGRHVNTAYEWLGVMSCFKMLINSTTSTTAAFKTTGTVIGDDIFKDGNLNGYPLNKFIYTTNIMTADCIPKFTGSYGRQLAKSYWYTDSSNNFYPESTAVYTIGLTTNAVKAIYLDFNATDGGAVYFNASTTSFLKSTADGSYLNMGGFKGLGHVMASSDAGGAAPTDAALDTAFGAPATCGAGFVGVYKNTNAGDGKTYLCVTDGTQWLYSTVTVAV